MVGVATNLKTPTSCREWQLRVSGGDLICLVWTAATWKQPLTYPCQMAQLNPQLIAVINYSFNNYANRPNWVIQENYIKVTSLPWLAFRFQRLTQRKIWLKLKLIYCDENCLEGHQKPARKPGKIGFWLIPNTNGENRKGTWCLHSLSAGNMHAPLGKLALGRFTDQVSRPGCPVAVIDVPHL